MVINFYKILFLKTETFSKLMGDDDELLMVDQCTAFRLNSRTLRAGFIPAQNLI